MSAWRTLVGGLGVWLVHFAIVYALPSLDAIGAAPPAGLMVAHGLATMTCLAVVGLLAVTAWRRGPAFQNRVAALGAAVAGVAIVWQSAPAWLS